MIVVDASAVLELLLQSESGKRVADIVLQLDEQMSAPHLLDVELTQAIRRLTQLKAITSTRGHEALADYRSLPIERVEHLELIARMWQLRECISAYDAAYVALAEALDAPLVTCDGKLARSHGHDARIELIS